MMNLEKMKHEWKKTDKNAAKKVLIALASTMCLSAPVLPVQNVFAEAQTEATADAENAEAQAEQPADTENAEAQETPAQEETAVSSETAETEETAASTESAETQAEPVINIEKPEGWRQGGTSIAITVDASQMPEGFSITKIEAKVGEDGNWQDVTETGSITINRNQTVYVRVTDGEGKTYEQNRSVKCYDEEKPTLSASLTNGILTVQGNDTISGITAITVNGTTYTDLTDGMLKMQLTQNNFTTKEIEITATDGSGNTSEKYILQNPYYEWAVQQAEKQNQSTSSTGTLSAASSTGASTATSTGTEDTTTSPLPQDSEASAPTEATGTVDERTVTGIEEELAENGETAETVTSTGTQDTKEFYTISTKSGKIFYLIVDNSKSSDNVYFLTEVSEKDLMNFTLSDTVTLPTTDTVYAVPESELRSETEVPPIVTEVPETDDGIQMPEDKSPLASYVLIGLIVAGIAAGGYYFKIYKPKHEYEDEDEYEYDENENETEEPEERDDAEAENSDPSEEINLSEEAENALSDQVDEVLEDEEENDEEREQE